MLRSNLGKNRLMWDKVRKIYVALNDQDHVKVRSRCYRVSGVELGYAVAYCKCPRHDFERHPHVLTCTIWGCSAGLADCRQILALASGKKCSGLKLDVLMESLDETAEFRRS